MPSNQSRMERARKFRSEVVKFTRDYRRFWRTPYAVHRSTWEKRSAEFKARYGKNYDRYLAGMNILFRPVIYGGSAVSEYIQKSKRIAFDDLAHPKEMKKWPGTHQMMSAEPDREKYLEKQLNDDPIYPRLLRMAQETDAAVTMGGWAGRNTQKGEKLMDNLFALVGKFRNRTLTQAEYIAIAKFLNFIGRLSKEELEEIKKEQLPSASRSH